MADILKKLTPIDKLNVDELYVWRKDISNALQDAKPWKKDLHCFRKCMISDAALIKMAMHSADNAPLEIMGQVVGFARGDTIVIVDCFPLPVVGIEYQVNPSNQCYEFMIDWVETSKQLGCMAPICGWYHSHPGFGLFLSGTDVKTQELNQIFNEPYVAIVVDPNRTESSGKVAVGAFRIYPPGEQKPPDSDLHFVASPDIPQDKAQDAGTHADRFYPLEVKVFKSNIGESLLSKLGDSSWMVPLADTRVTKNRDFFTAQVNDLTSKMSSASSKLNISQRQMNSDKKEGDSPLKKISVQSEKMASELLNGSITQAITEALFNSTAAQAK